MVVGTLMLVLRPQDYRVHLPDGQFCGEDQPESFEQLSRVVGVKNFLLGHAYGTKPTTSRTS